MVLKCADSIRYFNLPDEYHGLLRKVEGYKIMSMQKVDRNPSDEPVERAFWRSPLRRVSELGSIAGFWVVVALLTIVQEAFDPRFSGRETWQSGEALFIFSKYMIWVVLTPGIFWLIRFVGRIRSGWIQLLLHSVLGLAVSAIVHFIYHILWNFFLPASPQPISMLFVLSGLHFLPEFFLYLVVLAAGFARDYFLRYQERMRESAGLRADAAELRAQLADARLQTLHMQINPHFLFNTLHMISAYIERDPTGSRRIVTLLSELMRYTLEKSDEKEVSLAQELDFLDKYLEIQLIRFQGRLEIHRNIDPDTLDALVPSLILQPLVENAIKHGTSAIEATGRIDLSAWLESEQLHVTVHDNGPGLTGLSGDDVSVESPGIGLQNTRKRLVTLYREEQELILENAPEGGAVAHLTLPYHTPYDLIATVVQS